MYIYGSVIATGSFPNSNQGCQGWLKPTTVIATSHMGSKPFQRQDCLPAMGVWRDISSDEEVKEKDYVCCLFFLAHNS